MLSAQEIVSFIRLVQSTAPTNRLLFLNESHLEYRNGHMIIFSTFVHIYSQKVLL